MFILPSKINHMGEEGLGGEEIFHTITNDIRKRYECDI
jgi:hypothetical protein